ncbi:MAG: hypothetical protein AAF297_04445 [Planctomycetota bacterium]
MPQRVEVDGATCAVGGAEEAVVSLAGASVGVGCCLFNPRGSRGLEVGPQMPCDVAGDVPQRSGGRLALEPSREPIGEVRVNGLGVVAASLGVCGPDGDGGEVALELEAPAGEACELADPEPGSEGDAIERRTIRAADAAARRPMLRRGDQPRGLVIGQRSAHAVPLGHDRAAERREGIGGEPL